LPTWATRDGDARRRRLTLDGRCDKNHPIWRSARRRPQLGRCIGAVPAPCEARMPGDYGRRGRTRRRRIDAARLAAATARFFLCGRCRAQVLICSHFDRGQIYCGERCAGAARRNSLRAAGCRYQASRRGRLSHAARARCYRRRTNVTHQGSPADPSDALLPATPAAPDLSRWPGWRCHRCGRPCPPLVRRDFRRRRGAWKCGRGPRRDHPA